MWYDGFNFVSMDGTVIQQWENNALVVLIITVFQQCQDLLSAATTFKRLKSQLPKQVPVKPFYCDSGILCLNINSGSSNSLSFYPRPQS